MNVRPRPELIRLILDGHFPVKPLRDELAAYPWDADEPLVTLRPDHIGRILERFLGGELTSQNVQEWAEAVEARDDVDFADVPERDLPGIVFILANPDINGPLTPDLARGLLTRLDDRTD